MRKIKVIDNKRISKGGKIVIEEVEIEATLLKERNAYNNECEKTKKLILTDDGQYRVTKPVKKRNKDKVQDEISRNFTFSLSPKDYYNKDLIEFIFNQTEFVGSIKKILIEYIKEHGTGDISKNRYSE